MCSWLPFVALEAVSSALYFLTFVIHFGSFQQTNPDSQALEGRVFIGKRLFFAISEVLCTCAPTHHNRLFLWKQWVPPSLHRLLQQFSTSVPQHIGVLQMVWECAAGIWNIAIEIATLRTWWRKRDRPLVNSGSFSRTVLLKAADSGLQKSVQNSNVSYIDGLPRLGYLPRIFPQNIGSQWQSPFWGKGS